MTPNADEKMMSLEGDMIATEPDATVVQGKTAAIVSGSVESTETGAFEHANNTASITNKAANAEQAFNCDVLVVGAGFSGIKAIYQLRKLGLNVKVFEAGSDFGGVWHWNKYPGARVDSEFPFYQLNIPEVFQTWTFTERFPDDSELRQYFSHVDKTLGLRKDVVFNARVVDSSYSSGRWTVKTDVGHIASCKYLILATGLLHRRFIPQFPGLDTYKGQICHSGFWPDDFSASGKKVALVGAGATAVQITQELGKQAEQLTVFLRRPSYCLPMKQRPLSKQESVSSRTFLDLFFKQGRLSLAGIPATGPPCGVFDQTSEEREAWFEELWSRGGFSFQMCNYNNVLLDRKANREVYDFWAKKTRARLADPRKRDIMAPLEPPYFFGTKRNPLEMDYYEVISQDNVEVVDLNANPLEEFQPTGMLMSDKFREFDIVVLATGFDSFTGSLTNMGLKNKNGVDLKEVWSEGIWSYLGLTVNGFPNMFMAYSPQAPTALSNGPTIIESQIDWIVDAIAKLESEKALSIEPTHQAEVEWKDAINAMNNMTLFPFTSSWWTGGNIPGKKAEAMTYIGGIENYEKQCRAVMDKWLGFEVAHH